LGRPFYRGDDKAGQDSFVMLSHTLWQHQFAGDPAIVGKSIELEGVSRQVVGVMPASFRFPSPKTQIWVPLHNDQRDTIAYWADDFMPIIGRLRTGATIPKARAEIKLFQEQVFQLFPWPMPKAWNADVSVIELQQGMVADVRARLFLLLGSLAAALWACQEYLGTGGLEVRLSRGLLHGRKKSLYEQLWVQREAAWYGNF
jgi:hypothetical protein